MNAVKLTYTFSLRNTFRKWGWGRGLWVLIPVCQEGKRGLPRPFTGQNVEGPRSFLHPSFL